MFDAVKDAIPTRSAAKHYGLQVSRKGYCNCPFHNDKTPSMKLDRRFHCFGCNSDGDVIDFVARLFNLSPKEAAMKLADDFGISYDKNKVPAVKPMHREISESEKLKHQVNSCFHELSDYRHKLARWKKQYAPQEPAEELHAIPAHVLHRISLSLDREYYAEETCTQLT